MNTPTPKNTVSARRWLRTSQRVIGGVYLYDFAVPAADRSVPWPDLDRWPWNPDGERSTEVPQPRITWRNGGPALPQRVAPAQHGGPTEEERREFGRRVKSKTAACREEQRDVAAQQAAARRAQPGVRRRKRLPKVDK